MGCLCWKSSSAVKDSDDSPKQRELMRKTSDLRMPRRIVSRRQESFAVREKVENGELDRKVNGSRKVREDCYEKEKETYEVISNFPGIGRVPKAVEGAQVAAGWPTWLVAVAGEAIKGWIPRKADTFEKLDKIGQGTYSSVYKGRDLVSNKFVALKKIRFDNKDPESVKFMAREILILRRLDHPNVIKLEGLVTSVTSSSLYLVFEYMEHDLTGITSLPGVKFTEPQVKCYMQQLLRGLEYCHSHGVLHRDIKGSNLLIDNNGILKIADFGLASYFDNSLSVPLTSRVVTLWYRPPELLLGATHYGVAVDLWSAGCILGELYTGKPIMPGRTEVEQLHKIFKLCGSPSEEYWRKSKLPHTTVFKPTHPYRQQIAGTMKDLPYAAVQLMETLLAVDPSDRGTADSALKSEFFNTHPFACDPSSLPKYPPSKEIDAKLREEEKRRRGTVVGMKGQKCENDLKRSKELRAAPAPDANAELPRSMQQRRQGHPNPKSRSEYFNTYNDEEVVGSRPLKETIISYQRDAVHHSGPLAPGVGWRKHEDVSTRNDLTGPTSRAFSSSGSRDNLVSESFGDPMRKQDKRRHTQIFSGLQHMPSGKSNTREHYVIDGHKEKKINFSGPLGPSSNVEQILREHDRRIQEVARRLKHDKARAGRVRPQEIASYVSNESIIG